MTTAYLDIETYRDESITVVGLQVEGVPALVQMVAPAISADGLLGLIPRGARLYTFNGHGFDLPVIKAKLGIDLRSRCDSVDLYAVTRKAGIAGGQKKVEVALRRGTGFAAGFSDSPAVAWERPKPNTFELWDRWKAGDKSALDELLAYNAADVAGLIQIRDAMRLRGHIPVRFG